MRFTKLIVGGFKSLRDPVEIPIAPLTFMFGPNSAGKSAVKDAWFELKRKLSAPGSPHDESLARMLSRLGTDDLAHLTPERAKSPDDEDLSQYRVLLGCEIEEFAIDDEVQTDGQAAWSSMSRDMFERLAGESIRYDFFDEPKDFSSIFRLRVGGAAALQHFAFVAAAESGLIDMDELEDPRPDSKEKSCTLGLASIDISTAPFKTREFRALIASISQALAKHPASWAVRAISLDDSILQIRIGSVNRRLTRWSTLFYEVQARETRLPDDFVEVSRLLDILVDSVNRVLSQIEAVLVEHMNLRHVPGGRGLLEAHDLVTEFPSASDLKTTYSYNLVRYDYPLWLAMKASGIDLRPELLGLPPDSRDIEDFVNEMMSGPLFAPKKYQFKSELTVRTEEVLNSRNPDRLGDIEKSYRASLYIEDGHGRQLDIESVGSGISYVYPVLTSLWSASRSWIEQPELHLHPGAQCEMGDVILRAFNRGRFSIIETHSEHLLLRVLRRIRQTSEGKLQDRELQCPPEAVAVLYFAPQEDGSTQVHHLRVTRGGDFMDRWPDGFFEERSRELFDE